MVTVRPCPSVVVRAVCVENGLGVLVTVAVGLPFPSVRVSTSAVTNVGSPSRKVVLTPLIPVGMSTLMVGLRAP